MRISSSLGVRGTVIETSKLNNLADFMAAVYTLHTKVVELEEEKGESKSLQRSFEEILAWYIEDWV
jgi:hypothetical protein